MSPSSPNRPLLPIAPPPMQPFQFAPPNLGVGGETKKNYVFVDEHNRHKRLKVMRACEGCRRRKIRCDSATTNLWPCAACVRLKLNCVPPTVNYNRVQGAGSNASGLERVLDFDNSSGGSGDEDYLPQLHQQHPPQLHHQASFPLSSGLTIMSASQAPYGSTFEAFHSPTTYAERPVTQPSLSFGTMSPVQMPAPAASFQRQNTFPQTNIRVPPSVGSGDSWHQQHVSAEDLSGLLGHLKIDETGIAPYIYQQKQRLAEEAAFEEDYEMVLPPMSSSSGRVRIPPLLMPSNEQAEEYFQIYFNDIHPYVPVVSKSLFYNRWRTDQSKLSPLLLEAIFAAAGRLSQDPAQGAQWLALASKHENCFMDVPRLSTIQALLILLKARESTPKRGYYYRSWMTIKTLVSMAKDLELDDHYASHQEGRATCSDPTECLVKKRIWQNIYICEMMVGGPQGRFEMGVANESVDLGTPQPSLAVDDSDFQVTWQFTYLARIIRLVRSLTETYARVRRTKDWGSNPQLNALNPSFSKWLDELPEDLQLHYPPDGSPPPIPSHFVANLHCYYHLSILMLHRPQLMGSSSFTPGGAWKQHMSLCYNSAKYLCRLQEAIMKHYGINGLLCMQRGVNFVIYCVMTCTMLHLVATTSQDPDFNADAREYFTRQMRVLEACMPAWPGDDVQVQVQSLRQAFSADINKPFELKASFPYGSPVATRVQPTPPADSSYLDRSLKYEQPVHMLYNAQPMTPPISAGPAHEDSKEGSIASAQLPMMMPEQRHNQPPMLNPSSDDGNPGWNPTRIFEYGNTFTPVDSSMQKQIANRRRSQWHTAFGTPTSSISAATGGSMTSMTQQSPTLYSPAIDTRGVPHLQESMRAPTQQPPPQSYAIQPQMTPVPQMAQLSHAQAHSPTYNTTSSSYVSPGMWQDAVASTYDPTGRKRQWEMEPSFFGGDQQQVKRPR